MKICTYGTILNKQEKYCPQVDERSYRQLSEVGQPTVAQHLRRVSSPGISAEHDDTAWTELQDLLDFASQLSAVKILTAVAIFVCIREIYTRAK